jgi:hypothetical protein
MPAITLTHGSAENLLDHVRWELENSNSELRFVKEDAEAAWHREIIAATAEIVGKLEAGLEAEIEDGVLVEFSPDAVAWLRLARRETAEVLDGFEPIVGDSIATREQEAELALCLRTLDRILERESVAV